MGALTIKSYSFRYRSWELSKINSCDFTNTWGIPISYELYSLRVLRVFPAKSGWVTDWFRFGVDSFYLQRTFFSFSSFVKKMEEVGDKVLTFTYLGPFSDYSITSNIFFYQSFLVPSFFSFTRRNYSSDRREFYTVPSMNNWERSDFFFISTIPNYSIFIFYLRRLLRRRSGLSFVTSGVNIFGGFSLGSAFSDMGRFFEGRSIFSIFLYKSIFPSVVFGNSFYSSFFTNVEIFSSFFSVIERVGDLNRRELSYPTGIFDFVGKFDLKNSVIWNFRDSRFCYDVGLSTVYFSDHANNDSDILAVPAPFERSSFFMNIFGLFFFKNGVRSVFSSCFEEDYFQFFFKFRGFSFKELFKFKNFLSHSYHQQEEVDTFAFSSKVFSTWRYSTSLISFIIFDYLDFIKFSPSLSLRQFIDTSKYSIFYV
jgi:hypothetical protein